MIGFLLLFSVADPGGGAGGSRLGRGAEVSTPFTSYLSDKALKFIRSRLLLNSYMITLTESHITILLVDFFC